MSAVGNLYQNAQAESFMTNLKVEDIYSAGYETFADVAKVIAQVPSKKSTMPSAIDRQQNSKPTRPAGGLV
jgi:transposase InsO family protein